jgi:hypothetical protein
MTYRATVIVTVAETSVFEANLYKSLEQCPRDIQLLTCYDAKSQANALNQGIAYAQSDLIICPHQDVYFEPGWLETIERLAASTPAPWGVLGAAGTTHANKMYGTHSGLGMDGYQHVTAMTLDGSLLILRKSSGLRFDENLNRFHGYDVDICLESEARGFKNYVINLPMQHRTIWASTTRPGGAQDFQNALGYVAQKWHARGVGPIYTTFGTY